MLALLFVLSLTASKQSESCTSSYCCGWWLITDKIESISTNIGEMLEERPRRILLYCCLLYLNTAAAVVPVFDPRETAVVVPSHEIDQIASLTQLQPICLRACYK